MLALWSVVPSLRLDSWLFASSEAVSVSAIEFSKDDVITADWECAVLVVQWVGLAAPIYHSKPSCAKAATL